MAEEPFPVAVKPFPAVELPAVQVVTALLRDAGMEPRMSFEDSPAFVLMLLTEITAEVLETVGRLGLRSAVIVSVLRDGGLPAADVWRLLSAGACDVLAWPQIPSHARDVAARFERLRRVGDLMRSPFVSSRAVGASPRWRALLREVVEVGAFTDASVLVTGESGTGKEVLAQLVHGIDARRSRQELVVVDCTTLSPELSGSELFGHERGAFTGAVEARMGAFALANGGTLFLDEIGELPLRLQAQLLRVVQERKYKRVGSNVWQHAEFRLVCATNRDLDACVRSGSFRADLYHRIAGWTCNVPPLRERPEDILLLAEHFLAELRGSGSPLVLDESVRRFLVAREYPGNVRDLKQLVTRIWYRHAGSGAITAGDVPQGDRPPQSDTGRLHWPDADFERAIRRALQLRVGMKEISRAAVETAIRVALEEENENLHRAAVRLGVTDRALQLRRANVRADIGDT